MTATSPHHVPVMLREVLAVLNPRDGALYVDATFGYGGYSEAILKSADCIVWAIDRDPEAMVRGRELADRYKGRFTLLAGRYGDMVDVLGRVGVTKVDGIAFDIGVSSMQIDQAERGFSFRTDGPLDMRMEKSGPTAADVVNTMEETELANVIYTLGEERASRRVARAIVDARAKGNISSTKELASIVRSVVRSSRDGIDPATRTFQALRIHVNDELGELDRGLLAAERLLSPGGRLAVVSFHSLEDRRVKEFLRLRSGGAPRPSRHLPDPAPQCAPSFKLLKKGTIRPDAEETKANPRSRSARLRAAVRTEAPLWSDTTGARRAA